MMKTIFQFVMILYAKRKKEIFHCKKCNLCLSELKNIYGVLINSKYPCCNNYLFNSTEDAHCFEMWTQCIKIV